MPAQTELAVLLDELVRFKTTCDNPKEIDACASFISDFLRGSGIFVKRITINGRQSVMATLNDTMKPEVFLNAHFDVVPADDSMFTPRKKSGKMFGRGVLDCKAQIAVLMLLMKELSALPKRPDIGLMLTSDEEVGGASGVGSLLKSYDCRFAVVADGGKEFGIVTRHKAPLHIKLSAKGISAHGSTPWLGKNAADSLISAYERIRSLFPSNKELEASSDKWLPTISLGKFASGDSVNRVPDKAEMLVDIRLTEKEDGKSILRQIKRVCGGEVSVDILSSARVLCTSTDNGYIKKLKSSAEKVLGRPVGFSSEHGATDGRYFAEKGIPVAIIWSIGNGEHSSNESVDIESVAKLYSILKEFILSCNP